MPLEWHYEYKKQAKELEISKRDFIGISLNKQRINLDKVRAKARKEGYDIGYSRGHTEGYNKGKADGYQEGHQNALEEGKEIGKKESASENYEKGKKDGRIWFKCCICNKPIFITPWSDTHFDIMHLLNQMRWGHPECYDRLNRERHYRHY
jgi:flagellar biosynthesis/type III secretory pathway protein FliH